MLKSAVMCKALSCIPIFKQVWETEDMDEPMVAPVKLILSELKEKISTRYPQPSSLSLPPSSPPAESSELIFK
jgi:hypothetical protein